MGLFVCFLCSDDMVKCRACDHLNEIAIVNLNLSEEVRAALLLGDDSF